MVYHNLYQYIGQLRQYGQKARLLLLAALISVLSLLPVAVAGAANPQAPGLKPTPVAPAEAGKAVTAPLPSKAQAPDSLSVAATWSVNLTASSTYLWPKQYSTLTATANQDVTYTPYYVSIYDATAGSYIKICGTGTVCSIAVTHPAATTHSYLAYISLYPTANPPAGQQAVSSTVSVTWRSIGVSLAASPTTVAVNGTSTLTATATADVGPSPFYIQIYDATTGTRLKYCGFGAVCSVNTNQSVATTHRFIAYVSDYSTAYPPSSIQATSNSSFVTWANTNYYLSLTSVSAGYGKRTLTANSNKDVGPTPYYIEIFNLRTGTRIATCGTGTSCSITVNLAFGKTDFVAFTSSNSTSIPPSNTQASSNVTSATFLPFITLP